MEFHLVALGAEHDRTTKAIEALVELYDSWGKPAQATEWQAALSRPQL